MTKFNVGNVLIEIDGEPTNKLRVLKIAMDNWEKINNQLPIDSMPARRYNEDVQYVKELTDEIKEMGITHENFFLKEDMIKLNNLFRRYND
jgi:hypothetical protein|tara:strand:- start:365 stop:637 length:273 start_codon:yes stop_codon:yes gene_type:complete